MKNKLQEKIAKIHQEPGVYIFEDKLGKILYIGKATNLRSRVKSYFQNLTPTLSLPTLPTGRQAGQAGLVRIGSNLRPIERMIHEVVDIKIQPTDSVLEALILESNLIKKHQPKYNVDLKDDKSFSYAVITKEKFPRVLIARETELDIAKRITRNVKPETKNIKKIKVLRSTPCLPAGRFHVSRIYGPYTSKKQLEIALKIIRKIFPYHSNKNQTEKGCLEFQIGLCPGPYSGAITEVDYKKNIQGIRMILEGKKKNLLKNLEKEMVECSKKNEFEKAAEFRNKIFALKHTRDIALIAKDAKFVSHNVERETWNEEKDTRCALRATRVEAYDISNISGQYAVGSMVVFNNEEPNKKEYRKFKIKTVEGIDDVSMMREVLERRFHNDWPMPDLILLDGGTGHLNMAQKLLHEELGLAVDVVAVAKGVKRKNLDLRFKKRITKNCEK